jgi:integrase
MAKALTDIGVRNLKPKAARREVPDTGQRGLYVVIQPSGAKSYAVRYRHAGRSRKLTLQAGLTLAQARKAAADALFDLEQGRDPSVARKAAKAAAAAAQADTVEAICGEYMRREGPKLRTGAVREATLKRLVYPAFGRQPIASVSRLDIVRLLDKIADENGPRMSDIVLAILRRVFNWHAKRSNTFCSPIVRGMQRLSESERERTRTLNDDELRAVWAAAESDGGPYGALIRFLLLTGARRSEAAKMPRAEIEGSAWHLPAARNKVKVPLIRPLSAPARAVLDALQRIDGCPFAFTTSGKGPVASLGKRKAKFDKACGVAGWRLHDLRRTARTLMGRCGVLREIAERCLGHNPPGPYDQWEYYDEKGRAFEALAAQIDRIVAGRASTSAQPDNVVRLYANGG